MIRFSEFHFEVEFLKVPAITLWKINMEPKHGGLEDAFPFKMGHVQVPTHELFGGEFVQE